MFTLPFAAILMSMCAASRYLHDAVCRAVVRVEEVTGGAEPCVGFFTAFYTAFSRTSLLKILGSMTSL